ncbi:hypothetical protein SAMN04488056_110121 [Cohaesibacter marisflavi]|uniref:Uncharacterized protein n=1 Tax=Cohaesibacter marisflavi TaxID=655353 RepID=A0A1I5J1M4_9HYPH|nr:hypothetical protein [Cohaesibacter marisflavi]SFO66316.1 hypothetical protein SAMN04488056_110121 [Cohaesibacter marisflavi]
MNRANKKRAEKELKAAQKLFNAASYSQAAEICHNQIQTYPDFLPARELLAEIFFTLGKPHEASATMVDLAVKNPEDIELQSKTGRTLQRAKLFNDAVEFFQNAVTKAPTNSQKWADLIACMYAATAQESRQTGNASPAAFTPLVTLGKNALQSFPEDLQLCALVGDIFSAAGLENAAILCFKRAMQATPVIPEAHIRWLEDRLRNQAYEDIVAYSEKHANASLEIPAARRMIGASLDHLALFDREETFLSRALARFPEDAHLRAGRGRARMFLGKFEEALEDLNKSIRALPEQAGLKYERNLVQKNLGNIAQAAKDEYARFEIQTQNPVLDLDVPHWKGESIEGKRLLVWSDQGIGDVFKHVQLMKEIPSEVQTTLLSRKKTLDLLRVILPEIDIQQLPRQVETFQLEDSRDNAAGKAAAPIGLFPGKQQKRLMNKYEKVDGNYDYQIPLTCLYTLFRPNLRSFIDKTMAIRLPHEIMKPFLEHELMRHNGNTKVGLAWSSIKKNKLTDRNYLSLEDLLPILRLPGFDFFNLQYSASEEEIKAFREEFDVPIYHIPGLDINDDLLNTAAFTACLDLFAGPANSSADMAGAMGVKSYRMDLVHLPENLGQQFIPWYEDQFCRSIPWGKTVHDYLDDMSDWLLQNRDHRSIVRQTN